MCCIFTLCGWVIDLVQRLWTFTMSCCISSAVCCACVTAAMAGVALGYNYSLAEYIDSKETNVSVFLKRGVFDDDVVDDLDWRRQGGGGPPTAAPEAQRRMDAPDVVTTHRDSIFDPETTPKIENSVYESNDHHRYEGSLLRLTANPKPTEQALRDYVQDTATHQLQLVDDLLNRRQLQYTSTRPQTYRVESYSTDQVQAIQNLINRRKMAYKKMIDATRTTTEGVTEPTHEIPLRRMMRPKAGAMGIEEDETEPPKWYLDRTTTTPQMLLEISTARVPVMPKGMPSGVQRVVKRPYTTTHATTKILPPAPNYRKSLNDEPEPTADDREMMEHKVKEIYNIRNQPEGRDYDEKDIQGIPVRKRKGVSGIERVRIKRTINLPTTDAQNSNRTNKSNDKQQSNNRNTFFEEVSGIYKSFENLFKLPDKVASKTFIGESSKSTTFASSGIPSVDVVSKYSMPNVNSSTTKAVILNIINSTVISF